MFRRKSPGFPGSPQILQFQSRLADTEIQWVLRNPLVFKGLKSFTALPAGASDIVFASDIVRRNRLALFSTQRSAPVRFVRLAATCEADRADAISRGAETLQVLPLTGR